VNKGKEEVKAIQVRLPIAVYRELKKRTKESRRSLNAEIVMSLEHVIAAHEAYSRRKDG